MADSLQLVSLFENLSKQDWDSAKSVALRIAQGEQDRGHTKLARKLRGALGGLGGNGSPDLGPSLSSQFHWSKALVRCPAGPSLQEVELSATLRTTLLEILAEWEASRALARAGVPRRGRLLFHGPPGCGKTITARALAREMGVPAYVVRFDSLIGSYLGQTALHLREVFRYAANNRIVLLIDEIDVLGKRRGSQMDVGELDRIVVGLMQELDLTAPAGLVIGASNLSQHLDDALWRRFDVKLEFKAPAPAKLHLFAKRLTQRFNIELSTPLRSQVSKAKSYAAAEAAILDAVRRQIVAGAKSK